MPSGTSAAGFSVGEPRPEEAPALARIHVDGWRAAYGHLLDASWFGEEALARRTAQWTRWLSPASGADRPGIFRTGRDAQGEPVGLGVSFPDPAADPALGPQLTMLYIDQAWYGSGLAAALVSATIGDGPAHLWVAEDNPRARAFSAKVGFADDGTRQLEEHLGNLPDRRMVR